MNFCPKCGTRIDGSTCPNCGQEEAPAGGRPPSRAGDVAGAMAGAATVLLEDIAAGAVRLLRHPAGELRAAAEGLPEARRVGLAMIGAEAVLTGLLALMTLASGRRALFRALGELTDLLPIQINALALFGRVLLAIPIGILGLWLVFYPLGQVLGRARVNIWAGLAVTGLTRLPAIAGLLAGMVAIWLSVPAAAGLYLSGLAGAFAVLVLAVREAGHLDANRLMYLAPSAWLAGLLLLAAYARVVM